jgi:hypothetical protein
MIRLDQAAARAAGPKGRGEPAAPAADIHDRRPGNLTVARHLVDRVGGDGTVEELRIALLGPEQPQQPQRTP